MTDSLPTDFWTHRLHYVKLCLGGLGIDADAIRWEWRGEPDYLPGEVVPVAGPHRIRS